MTGVRIHTVTTVGGIGMCCCWCGCRYVVDICTGGVVCGNVGTGSGIDGGVGIECGICGVDVGTIVAGT